MYAGCQFKTVHPRYLSQIWKERYDNCASNHTQVELDQRRFHTILILHFCSPCYSGSDFEIGSLSPKLVSTGKVPWTEWRSSPCKPEWADWNSLGVGEVPVSILSEQTAGQTVITAWTPTDRQVKREPQKLSQRTVADHCTLLLATKPWQCRWVAPPNNRDEQTIDLLHTTYTLRYTAYHQHRKTE